jgi:hypothetical protein
MSKGSRAGARIAAAVVGAKPAAIISEVQDKCETVLDLGQA